GLMLKKILPAAFMVAVALLIPVNEAVNPFSQKYEFLNEELQAKEAMAVELKEVGALSDQDLKNIKKEIEKIKSAQARQFSHERWEALDGIGERMLLKADGNLSLRNWASSAVKEMDKEINSGQNRSMSKLAKQAQELEKALKSMAGNDMLANLPSSLISQLGKRGARALSKDFKIDPNAPGTQQMLRDLDKFLRNSGQGDTLRKYNLQNRPGMSYDLAKGQGKGG
ncbi:hypothetical protein ACFL4W_05725, partial [Planctomycetota bacterium]